MWIAWLTDSMMFYSVFKIILVISRRPMQLSMHSILSKPLASFPYNHYRNNGQLWEKNESHYNYYHQSSNGISAESGIEQANSCSQVSSVTDSGTRARYIVLNQPQHRRVPSFGVPECTGLFTDYVSLTLSLLMTTQELLWTVKIKIRLHRTCSLISNLHCPRFHSGL